MLKCRDVPAQVGAHVDGQLNWRQDCALRLHLLICAVCRRFVRQYRLADATALTALERPAGDAEVQAVLNRIRQPPAES